MLGVLSGIPNKNSCADIVKTVKLVEHGYTPRSEVYPDVNVAHVRPTTKGCDIPLIWTKTRVTHSTSSLYGTLTPDLLHLQYCLGQDYWYLYCERRAS